MVFLGRKTSIHQAIQTILIQSTTMSDDRNAFWSARDALIICIDLCSYYGNCFHFIVKFTLACEPEWRRWLAKIHGIRGYVPQSN